MNTDPIADFLTRIRNANSAGHRVVEVPASKLKLEITKILFDQGYILSYKQENDSAQGTIKIALKYDPITKDLSSRNCSARVRQDFVNTLVLSTFHVCSMDLVLPLCQHLMGYDWKTSKKRKCRWRSTLLRILKEQ